MICSTAYNLYTFGRIHPSSWQMKLVPPKERNLVWYVIFLYVLAVSLIVLEFMKVPIYQVTLLHVTFPPMLILELCQFETQHVISGHPRLIFRKLVWLRKHNIYCEKRKHNISFVDIYELLCKKRVLSSSQTYHRIWLMLCC